MDLNASNNTVVVVNGGSGIGRGLGSALHGRGCRIIVASPLRRLRPTGSTCLPGTTEVLLDLADPEAPARLAAELGARVPGIDALIVDAGLPPSDGTEADVCDASLAEAVVAVDVIGVLRAVKAFLPLLRRRSAPTIMVVTSLSAFVPRADAPIHSASMAFLHSWLQSLRHSLRGTPVEVLELAPPPLRAGASGDHRSSERDSMTLDAYVAEVIDVLDWSEHAGGEVLVERGRELRYAERRGRYEATFAEVNALRVSA